MGNKLEIDAGIRWQNLKADVVRLDRNMIADLTPAGVVAGSTADTTADNEVSLPGEAHTLKQTYRGFGWSLGGTRNCGVARPLFGRTLRFSLTYLF